MPPNRKPGRILPTTIGEFVEAVYDCAMEEYMDEIMARRITMQMLLRKLRQERRVKNVEPLLKPLKKAYLQSELNKMRKAKS